MPYRFTCLLPALLLLSLMLCAERATAQVGNAVETTLKSFVYKTVDGQKLSLDVHMFNDQRVRPVVFWIHGGALIMGSRYINPFIHDYFSGNDFVVVTFDYRLAPFAKLPDIYQDVTDAYKWTCDNIKQYNGDPKQIVVGGESAGGYLTFALGPQLKPKPLELFAFSGYGNIITPWYTEPSEHYLKIAPLQDREKVFAALQKNPTDGAARVNFYLYTRQTGQWPNILLGHDPKTEAAAFTRYCPVLHVGKDYPPVVFTHCKDDTDVPFSEAEAMVALLKNAGVDYQFIQLEGSAHAFNALITKTDAATNTRKAVMDFLKNHLKPTAK
jgi:acetyl esterase/lipase